MSASSRERFSRAGLVAARSLVVALVGSWFLGACTSRRAGEGTSPGEGEPQAQAPAETTGVPAAPPGLEGPRAEAGHIQVQHILIGFRGSVPGKAITRTQEEARTLAYDLLERARRGEDFGELVRQHTDDQHPGVYGLADRGVTPGPGEYPRDGMVAAFGDVGFTLQPGEVGIADHDPARSPYGWHVIKRLR